MNKTGTERLTTGSGPRYVVAMVLGTALSTLGPAAPASADAPDSGRAVSDISRYCAACWRNARLHPDCWTDCTQEVFTRLLERVSLDTWPSVLQDEGDERREFLRAIDAVKKRTQRSRKYAPCPTDAVGDRRDGRDRHLTDERDAVKQAAAGLLSPRQRDILGLSFDGWSVQEIAGELKMPAERVSDEKYKAIRKLRDHFGPAA
jgi:RNA polymerase sigma factor (sigma-70 family)